MLPESQKPSLQPALNASFAMLTLLPPCDDIRLFAHDQTAVHPTVFVANAVPWDICIVHSHISDRIWTRTCLFT